MFTKRHLRNIRFMIGFMLLIVLISCDSNPTKPVPVTGVSLNHTSLTLEMGMSETLIATVEPSKAKNQGILWSSSDENIAAVSEDGVVTAISGGTAIITVTTLDGGFGADCIVMVPFVFTVENTDQWNESVNFINENGNDKIFVIDVISFIGSQEIYFYDARGITVKINGNHHVTGYADTSANQNITINDIALEGAVVRGDGAILTMQGDSSIKNSKNSGVRVSNNGTFIMLDGIISENTAWLGGGVHIASTGTFILKGGTISNNRSLGGQVEDMGGGVYINSGTFIMLGGLISENYSSSFGGGIHATNNSVLIMTDGIVSKNRSGAITSAIYLDGDSSFIMSGGSISGNSSAALRLGAYPNDSALFSMTGGIISGNNFGVYLGGFSSFVMPGGTIYGSETTGVPEHLANGSFSLTKSPTATAKYGDETDIFPHTDGHIYHTNYTIIGR